MFASMGVLHVGMLNLTSLNFNDVSFEWFLVAFARHDGSSNRLIPAFSFLNEHDESWFFICFNDGADGRRPCSRH